MRYPQVKICGLTDPAQASASVDLGVDAIGVVFHLPSPRHLSFEQAKKIVDAVGNRAVVVALFVDQKPERILERAAKLGISWVQLHGNETPQMVEQLVQGGLQVIKVLRSVGTKLLEEATLYSAATALLVEAGRGELPGGNGVSWSWEEARLLADLRPFALAGGLHAGNIVGAAQSSCASLLDLSSGVEVRPGVKDLEKVSAVLRAVRTLHQNEKIGEVIG